MSHLKEPPPETVRVVINPKTLRTGREILEATITPHGDLLQRFSLKPFNFGAAGRVRIERADAWISLSLIRGLAEWVIKAYSRGQRDTYGLFHPSNHLPGS